MAETTGREGVPDRVLIVGGESGWGEKLVSVFGKAGFSVVHVPAREGVLQLGVLKPDMVILDESLPSSMEVCYQYATARIPVIIVGDDPSQEIWRKTVEDAGAEFYLRKPISHRILIARVRAILRRYKQRSEYQSKASGTVN